MNPQEDSSEAGWVRISGGAQVGPSGQSVWELGDLASLVSHWQLRLKSTYVPCLASSPQWVQEQAGVLVVGAGSQAPLSPSSYFPRQALAKSSLVGFQNIPWRQRRYGQRL